MSATVDAPLQAPAGLANAPATARPGAPKRRALLIVLAIALGLAGAVWFAHWWAVGRFVESTDARSRPCECASSAS